MCRVSPKDKRSSLSVWRISDEEEKFLQLQDLMSRLGNRNDWKKQKPTINVVLCPGTVS
jgi:hypothetical protein